jgi:DNA-damage-inducible protein D
MAKKAAQKSKSIIASGATLIERLLVAFEHARRVDDGGREYWSAREYAKILGYKWQSFENVIERGKAALEPEDGNADDHFTHVRKMAVLGSGAERDIGDIELTRRACYLVGINGDPRKKETVAAVQRYFVETTRKHEILEQVTADAERLHARKRLNKNRAELKLESATRGVRDHGFKSVINAGNEALFNQAPTKTKAQLGVPEEREIEDFADPVLVAGMALGTAMTTRQTREKDLKGATPIARENAENHSAVRRALTDRKIIPEKLPPAGDIKTVEERVAKRQKKLAKHSK